MLFYPPQSWYFNEEDGIEEELLEMRDKPWEEFEGETKYMDIDFVQLTGHPSFLSDLVPTHFDIGRTLPKECPEDWMYITTGPFYVLIEADYHNSLCNKIEKWRGLKMEASGNPKLLYNGNTMRIGTADLVMWLNEIGCRKCIAKQYGMKMGLKCGKVFEAIKSTHPYVKILLDIGIEIVPRSELMLSDPRNIDFIPCVFPISNVPGRVNWTGWVDDYLIEKYNLFRFLQLESESRGGHYGGIRVVPREGKWEQAKIKQLKVYPKAVHIWKSAMTNLKFRMPQNIFGLKKLRSDVRNVFERLVNSEGNLRVLRLESRVELKGKVQDACAEAYVATIHALNKICIYELPFQQVVSVSTKLLVRFKNRFKGDNGKKLSTEQKCLDVAMASMIGV